MKILLTGGGTGGHITPLLAVAQKLKTRVPAAKLVYVGERGSKFAHMAEADGLFDAHQRIFAGKFRRYHGVAWYERLFDVKTNLLNVRDSLFVLLGFVQSVALLLRLKPDVILLKGGFVGVPIGLAAALLRIPFVTHDSDAIPGLANRLVARWATRHAIGMPPQFYKYDPESMEYVGVLVGEAHQPITGELKKAYRLDLKLPVDGLVLLVTGGSLGAQRLNKAMNNIAPTLLTALPSLHIIHQVGKGNTKTYGNFTHPRLEVTEFLHGMHRFTGAADVVVTRAGANTLAELGVQGKACIVVPNPLLTGGHQLKNAEHLTLQGAILTVTEKELADDNAVVLETAIRRLLDDPDRCKELGKKLQDITVRDAADKLARLLVQIAQQGSVGK